MGGEWKEGSAKDWKGKLSCEKQIAENSVKGE